MARRLILFLFIGCLNIQLLYGAAQLLLDSTKKHSLFFYPILYYTPETSLAFGGTMQYIYRSEKNESRTRPSSITPMLIYTLKKQIIATLPLDFYWKKDVYHLFTTIQYKDYPDVFYGIGNDTHETDLEDYTSRELWIQSNFKWRFLEGFYTGIQYEYIHSKLTDTEEAGLLSAGDIVGSEKGKASGFGLLFNWDTRDNVFSPSRGRFHQLSATWFDSDVGSDYDFNRYTVDLREYLPLFHPNVLALQGFIQIITGIPPFYMMSQLGGSNMMRGYFYGRYRDRNMCAFQAEYRFFVWGPFGGVVFAGFGDVSHDIDNLFSKNLKPTYGFGIRFLLDPKERINFRVDFGFGEGTSGIYFGAIEVF